MATIYDKLRQLPTEAIDPNNLIGLRHRGKMVEVSGSVTVPASVFSNGDMVGIFNDSASPIQIIEGPDLTLGLENSAGPTTGNRTVAPYAMASIWFQTTTDAWVTGGGVT